MARNRLRYFIALLCAAVFFFCFDGYLSLYVLVLVLALPPLSLLLSLPGILGTSLELVLGAASTGKGQDVPLQVRIKNSFPLAGVRSGVTLTVRNTLTGMAQEEHFRFLACRGEQIVQHRLSSPGCGQVICELSKARAWDYLGLFALPLRLPKQRESVLFYPAVHQASLLFENISAPDSEGDTYSKTKAGDDPSELFGLREYREGDRLSRVHWKLSQKTGQTLVKELGFPIADHLFFLTEPNGTGTENDALLDVFATLSSFLTERETAHRAAFWDSTAEQLALEEIITDDDLKSALQTMLLSGHGPDLPPLGGEELPAGVSHGLYLSCHPVRDTINELRLHMPSARLSVLRVTDDTELPDIPLPERAKLFTIPPGKIEEALDGFEL